MTTTDLHPITAEVLARFAATPDPRLREVMAALIRHLHGFAREVRLTEAEWFEAIGFLTEVGRTCDANRQEFILLSDTLGLSMLMTDLNHEKPPGCTEPTVFGPFHVPDAPHFALGADIAAGAPGEPCWVQGRVLGADGVPVGGAELDVWQADAQGFYDVQRPELTQARGRGRLHADAEGRFRFWTIVAEAYPVPSDGPVGRMLAATGGHPWRPAHLHFMITAPGHERLITHVFRRGGPYLESDAVFGVRPSLVADWLRHDPGTAPDGSRRTVPWWSLDFDFVLNRAAVRAPRPNPGDAMSDTALIAELEAADDRRAAATVAGDRSALDALLAPDLRYVHGSGTDEDKATYLERATTGWYDYRSLEPLRREWRVWGDIALCNGDVRIEVRVKGTPKAFTSRYLQVWRRDASGWRMASWQSTPLPT